MKNDFFKKSSYVLEVGAFHETPCSKNEYGQTG